MALVGVGGIVVSIAAFLDRWLFILSYQSVYVFLDFSSNSNFCSRLEISVFPFYIVICKLVNSLIYF